MKFGKYYKDNIISKWKEAFLDYKWLKSMIKEVEKQKINSESNLIKYLEASILKCDEFYMNIIDEIARKLKNAPNYDTCKEITASLNEISKYAWLNEVALHKIIKNMIKNFSKNIYYNTNQIT